MPYLLQSKKKKSLVIYTCSGMGVGTIYTYLGENHSVFMSNVFNQIRKNVYFVFVVVVLERV